MRIAYFHCFSGISGDMCLGALVDAGVRLKELSGALRKLPVKGYRLSEEKVKRTSLSATKVDVVLAEKSGKKLPAVRWGDIEKIIDGSSLPEEIREKGLGIFRRLIAAEARVHGETFERVHLHELGAVDCLVDIFGTLIGLELLGIERVYSSPLNLGSGSVQTGHGLLPVPAPATSEIVRGVPVYSSNIPFELTTPTGAVLISSLAQGFGDMPLFTPDITGTGAGGRDIEGSPNVLRIFVGEMQDGTADGRVTVVETNIDDMNPQVYEYLFERLFADGALDVFFTNVVMKKMRPGIKLTVLCEEEDRDTIVGTILKETTSIGVRYYETPRVTMAREIREVRTRFGKVRVKVSRDDRILKSAPEYEDCKKRARECGASLLDVIEEAKEAAKEKS